MDFDYRNGNDLGPNIRKNMSVKDKTGKFIVIYQGLIHNSMFSQK